MERYEYNETERKILEKSPVPYAIYQFLDRRVVTLIISDGFCRLFNYEDKEKAYYDMDHNMYQKTDPEDAARIADVAYRFATEGGRYDVIYRSADAEEQTYTMIHAVGEHFYTETGERLAIVWYIDEGNYSIKDDPHGNELTEALKKAIRTESLLRASYYDNLTGLPSMTYFLELASAGCKKIIKNGGIVAFLFFDLSGMKNFNLKHGFSAGDSLLRNFSDLLVNYFSNENCSRFGQDHFAVFTEESGIDDKLHQIFRDWQSSGNSKSLPVRVGVYLVNSAEFDISIACDNAKIACDMLKNSYVSKIRYYNNDIREDLEKREYIISNLDKAISEGWISAYYQPIVRGLNGRVCDEEALARWIDPEKGVLSPADFIPILEEAHLIYKLDLFMLDLIIDKLKKTQEAGLHLVPQSLNLSRVDFDECDVVSEICKKVDRAGISHDLITLEITESVIAEDFEFMRKQITRLKKLGFSVWMDDFGSGYSSLEFLQNLDFDVIKFDMLFLQNLEDNVNNKVILTALMRMITALGYETLCEGVETIEHVNFLKEIGCCKFQGYYYAKPMPYEKIFERYKTGKQIGFENPLESSYFDVLGRINVFDLDCIIIEDRTNVEHFFNTIPIVILELTEDSLRIVRSNQPYRDFSEKILKIKVSDVFFDLDVVPAGYKKNFVQKIIKCSETDEKSFDVIFTDDDTRVHTFMRRIAVNPVSGKKAVAIAILSSDKDYKQNMKA
ncbi:MAG: GGDEF domain-containing phosphodiesterase [Lachnospiraceae bacterium]|nr:GGDEF domain-containing phosphodiesterase [Lachnospiraceae bacterium]